ncbi:MAG: hypothetical protein WAL85_09500 [Candidatus Korobacteraceae bacterium]
MEKAVGRLAAGDESGAITSACGAVDATTTMLYEKHNLGKSDASFQAKVNTVLNRLGVFEKLEKELQEVGMPLSLGIILMPMAYPQGCWWASLVPV